MKRANRITAWILGCLALLAIGIIGYIIFKDRLNPEFKETRIYPDETRVAPPDTVFIVNGVRFKMIGVKGGKIDCQGLEETIQLKDFYIAETEVTQELWKAIMDRESPAGNPGDSFPVENVDLVDCLEFVNRLDSISGHYFNIPSYPQWLYAAHLGKAQSPAPFIDSIARHKGNSNGSTHPVKEMLPNRLGIYDMFGNVAEWTFSGADPLFIVAGGSFENEMEKADPDFREFDHVKVRSAAIGLRLVASPPKQD